MLTHELFTSEIDSVRRTIRSAFYHQKLHRTSVLKYSHTFEDLEQDIILLCLETLQRMSLLITLKTFVVNMTKWRTWGVIRYYTLFKRSGVEQELVDFEYHQEFDSFEKQEVYRLILKSLDPVDAIVIKGRFIGGLTFREIAAKLKVSKARIQQREKRAILKIRSNERLMTLIGQILPPSLGRDDPSTVEPEKASHA